MIEGYTLPRNAEMDNVFYYHFEQRSKAERDSESPANPVNASFRA